MAKGLLSVALISMASLTVLVGCAPGSIEEGAALPESAGQTIKELTVGERAEVTEIALNRLWLGESGLYQIVKYGWTSIPQEASSETVLEVLSPEDIAQVERWYVGGVVQIFPAVVITLGDPPQTEVVVAVDLSEGRVVKTFTRRLTLWAKPTPLPTPPLTEQGGSRVISGEQSQGIAQRFVLEEPTFKYDGMEGTLRLVAAKTLSSPYAQEFVFEFQSRHSGYGDRTGMVLLQVITPHTVRIVVEEGKVVSAVMDERWDMMEQKFMDNTR